MPTPQNGQKRSNKSSAFVDEFFECVWPFCGVGAQRVKGFDVFDVSIGYGKEPVAQNGLKITRLSVNHG